MEQYSFLPSEGTISTGEIFRILAHMNKNAISGVLSLRNGDYEKQLVIEGNKIVFATSTLRVDAFGDYLLRNHLIDRNMYKRTSEYMSKYNKRFGRALIELGYFSYDQIWTWIPNHLKSIVFSVFNIKSGTYRLILDRDREVENISLDLDIIDMIVAGIRRFNAPRFLEEQFDGIQDLYLRDSKLMSQLHLKPYEIHVYDLVRRNSSVTDILKRSELLESDTLRLLFLFLVLEIISTEKVPVEQELPRITQAPSRLSTFRSFEEALKYYNMKYEVIYKVMLKQIGPISHSLLFKAVEDILENLPSYFQKIQLKSDGTLDEDPILKAVYYLEFDQHIADFLRALEEILYTKIYSVKKHLGIEYEQQVLKWISGLEN